MTITTARDVSRALQKVGAEVRDEVRRLVSRAADDIAAEIEQGYRTRVGRVTGTLRDRGVRIVDAKGVEDGTAKVVFPLAPHAHLVEYGTRSVRRTRRGAGRGVMPPTAVVIPAARRLRRKFFEDVSAAVEKVTRADR